MHGMSSGGIVKQVQPTLDNPRPYYRRTLRRLVARVGSKAETERLLGVGSGSIAHWEAGRFAPSLEIRWRIDDAYWIVRRMESGASC